MRLSDVIGYALSVSVAAIMLAGCGGSQPPIGAPGAMPQSAAIATHAERGGSWMVPDAQNQGLLYVSNGGCCGVSVYSYPNGTLRGRLKGFESSFGQCVDAVGDVYITDEFAGRVYEYVHGSSKRLRSLAVPGAISCSIDPTSGDLAISSGGGPLSIFKNARGKPATYQWPGNEMFFCGYDNKGNVFVNGLYHPGTGHFILAELPKGGSGLKTITLNQYIGWPGGIQWHYKYLVLGDATMPAVYQFKIVGTKGIKVGVTQIGSKEYSCQQFWIQGSTLIAPETCASRRCRFRGNFVLFFKYPAGGKPTKKITAGVGFAVAASVSIATK
jgi:hypothetical protein